MLRPNIFSEIQRFLKTLTFGYSNNVTQFLTVILIIQIFFRDYVRCYLLFHVPRLKQDIKERVITNTADYFIRAIKGTLMQM